MDNPFELLTINEAARYLKKTPSTLYRWIREGSGPPHFNVNGTIRYRASEMQAWLEANRVSPEAKAAAQ